jgi:mRNA interferase MazF
MQSTTLYRRGDIILVDFVFTVGTGTRRRPALLLTSDTYHRGRQEAIVAAITSNTDRLLVGDYLIAEWSTAGLRFPSVATGIIRTIKQWDIVRKLGSMSPQDMTAVEAKLTLELGY